MPPLEAILASIVRAELAAAGLAGDPLDQRIERAVERVLDRRADGARLLDSAAVAELLGTTRRALAQRLRRGDPLGQLSIVVAGRRRWRRQDVEAAISAGRQRPTLRAVAGGGR